MIIALILMLIGGVIGIRAKVFVLIPVCFVMSAVGVVILDRDRRP